jgi:glycosyltransferase involved in cell wall biosynthesis
MTAHPHNQPHNQVHLERRLRDAELPSVAIVIPAYNESAIIKSTMSQVGTYLEGLADLYRWEIVVVDDGSKDRTGDLAQEFADAHPQWSIRVLRHFTNFNLGQTLRFAFNDVHTDYLVTIDCDLSYSVDHIGRLLDKITSTRAKVVLASPYAEGGDVANVPGLRRLLSKWANKYLAVGVKGELSTLTGMVRAYDVRFLQQLDLSSMDVGINTEIIYKARILNAKIEEVPAALAWITEGGERRVSKFKIIGSMKTYLLSGYLFRPLLSFAIPGFAFLGLSLFSILLILKQWLTNDISLAHSFGDSPATAIIASVAFAISLQFFGIGLLAWQSKRNFENLFHLGSTNLRAVRDIQRRLDPPFAATLEPAQPAANSASDSEA